MESRSHAFTAGMFTLLLLAGLIFGASWLSGRGNAFRDPYILVSRASIGGLEERAAVRLRGVEVGRVETVRFDAADPRIILVHVSLTPGTHVTDKTYGRVSFRGVTGIAYVELNEDDEARGQRVTTSFFEPRRLELRPSALSEFGDAGQALIVRANEIAGRLSTLFDEGNQRRVSRTLSAIERTAAKFAAAQDKLAPTFERLPAVADNTRAAIARADKLMAELSELTHRLNERVTTLDSVQRGADAMGGAASELSGTTLPALNRLLERLARTTEDLERVLETQADHPQSVIFGAPPGEPGPGEPGFGRARPERRQP